MHPWGRADHGMHREADRMTTDRLEGNKAVVQLLVDRVINQWRMDELALVFAKEAARKARDRLESFRKAIPDWRMVLKKMGNQGDNEQRRSIHVLDLLDFHMEPMSGGREV